MSTRTVTRQPNQRPPQRTLLWVALILFVALAANGVAYVFLRKPTPPQPGPAATAPGAAAEDENEGLARARRAAGIAALEHRDYDKAVTELTEALRLRKDKGDLAELLNIANELRTRDKDKDKNRAASVAATPPAPPPEPAPVPAPSPSRSSSKSSKPVRVATRTPPPEPPPAPEPPRNGLLLVTSTPPGLVVTVDGKTVDLTPVRLQVKAGPHRVTLAQGERRVLDETVEVGEDAVKPITWEAKPEPPPAVVASAAPAPAPTPPAPTKPPPAPVETVAAKPPPAPVEGKGDLEVSSPSLYGEIWINDHPYGFPPVTARGLPAGKARVEVRVQGAVKRKMTVDVVPGTSTPVRVR
ncbi:MAG TPA: PEGA domain-containing protein [Myxococcaceae bacterium]|nr:PEGA domain-containing protein [Myxococcaceae bacterium]